MNTILEERDAAVAYLSDKDTLLFTHAELEDLIDAFVDHLKCNRSSGSTFGEAMSKSYQWTT
jgi:hypothetical protein